MFKKGENKMKLLRLIMLVFLFLNICISTSNAQFWEKMNFNDGFYITCLAVDSSNRFWVGTSKGGYYYYKELNKWYSISQDSTYIINIKIIKDGKYKTPYIISRNLENNTCNIWEFFGNGYQQIGPSGNYYITSICADKDSIKTYSAIGDTSNGGVLRGYSGRTVNTGLPIVNDSIKALDITNKNDTLYVGLANGLYYSTDNGDSWLPVSFFDGLEVDKFVLNSKNDLYFIVSGTNENRGLYKNFVKIYDDVLPLVAVAVNRNDDVFIASNIIGNGVFWTSDNGSVWQDMYDGLDSCEITELICDIDGFIYAGTNGQGIYKSLKSTTKVNETYVNKSKITPNPFTEKTNISFYLDNPSYTKITIYNSLGNIIDVLDDNYLEAGNHEYTFDGSPLPSGTYFYVLQSAGNVETGKLVLIK